MATKGVTTSFLNTPSMIGGSFKKIGLIGTTCLFLVGCDSMWPSLDASDPAGGSAPTAASTSAAVQSTATATPEATSTAPMPTSSTTLYSSTTAVGERVAQMESDLSQLSGQVTDLKRRLDEIRGSGAASATAYHSYKAEITSRLQLGTTPGNPVLVEQWNSAQGALANVEQAIPALTSLHNDCADQAAFGKFLLSTVQATYGLSGAVDEDHRRLRVLEDAVHQSLVDLDRMLTNVTQEINRHNLYVSNERQNMTTLALGIKNGELYGTNIASRSFALVEAAAASAAASGPMPSAGSEPLVIIRFDRENVQYQQALYNAVSQALTAKPNAVFDLVAVSPDRGNAAQVALNGAAARRNAEDVLRTLTDMGVQPGRINLMADSRAVANNEVHLFVR
ncbi:hypothetical protein HH303_12145 [Rhodospirillaceae bacterium KN72]|uniref:Uncharacterized protein n=1 Tax=Pacificispira spongiicola TaxID=2729598 RepID=A0A7Y0E107_9PROT|nr:hypothetical protein [Pacificispira spongiicola]NMM45235.1 hypothetical protein [Pacificispira spongiicola]